MYPKVLLLMTLVMITQLTQIRSLPTPTNQSNTSSFRTFPDDSDKHSYFPHLYVFGGLDENGKHSDSASRLKSTTGEWATMNNMQTEQAYACGAVVGKQIYLFGGETSISEIKDSAEVYDCLTDIYTLLPPMPQTRSYCASATMKNSVYVSGGWDSGDATSLIRYDIRANQWSPLTPMKAPRWGHQLVELGGLLYAIGWNTTTEVYNPTTDRWSNVAGSNFQHYYPGAAAHKGNIYVISWGGFEVYSPDTNQWTVLNASENVKRRGTSLLSMNGKLWAVGGAKKDAVGKYKMTKTNTIYTYVPSNDRWSKEREMNTPRYFHSSFVVNL